MDDFLKLFGAVMNPQKGLESYEKRCIGRDPVDGVIVSTVFTEDCGYETAVLMRTKVRIVERYASKEEAVKGHAEWMKKIVGKESIMDTGYGLLLEEEEYPVERMTKSELAKKMKGFEKLRTRKRRGKS